MIIPEDLLDRLLGPDRHVYQGLCPDACNGLASRDPECPHCADLIMADVLRAAATKPPGQIILDDDAWRLPPVADLLVAKVAGLEAENARLAAELSNECEWSKSKDERIDKLLAELDAERAEAKRLWDALPKSHDGVTVLPGMKLYRVKDSGVWPITATRVGVGTVSYDDPFCPGIPHGGPVDRYNSVGELLGTSFADPAKAHAWYAGNRERLNGGGGATEGTCVPGR